MCILRPFVNLEYRHGTGNLSESTLRTLKGRFEPRGSEFPADFETWNNLRQSDGFLCRSDEECRWILDSKGGLAEHEKLHCRQEDVNASVAVEVRYLPHNIFSTCHPHNVFTIILGIKVA